MLHPPLYEGDISDTIICCNPDKHTRHCPRRANVCLEFLEGATSPPARKQVFLIGNPLAGILNTGISRLQ